MDQATKTCCRCGLTKALDEFYPVPHKNKLRSHCKACHNTVSRAWRKNNKEQVLLTRQRWMKDPAYRAKLQRAKNLHLRNNPEKQKAYHAVRKALKHGQLIRPEACQKCGAVSRLHAHHKDYSKPLEVDWLCIQCHELEHHPQEVQ